MLKTERNQNLRSTERLKCKSIKYNLYYNRYNFRNIEIV